MARWSQTAQAPLSTYNAIPSGAVGRFYTVNPGNVNLKMYMTAKLEPKGDSLVYDQSVTLTEGKQNVFVHAFDQPPVLFDNGFPYISKGNGNYGFHSMGQVLQFPV